MHDRMQYLRLMYTCLFQASDSGNSCLSPLQFRFPVPTSQWTAGSVHTNSYLFAGSLLVSPIVNDTKGAATFKAYIPAANGSWVNMADWTEVVSGTNDVADLKVRDTVNVHIAPGSIIPFQNN
jgi:alpha-glucosidase (family GH31 glycosyl hydrolase)